MSLRFCFTTAFLLSNVFLFGQKNEIGIGMPSVAASSTMNLSSASRFDEIFNDNSEIYMIHWHTKRSRSSKFPTLYYTRKVSDRFALRTSLNFQKERITKSQVLCNDCGSVSDDYIGKFSQLKLSTGFNYYFRSQKKSNFYLAFDLTHNFKHIYEKGHYENWAWGYTYIDYSKNIFLYYIGFNPALGFKQQIYKSLSLSYEIGFDLSYSTNKKYRGGLLFLNPLNRLSLNYNF